MPTGNIVSRRPAEVSGVAGSAAILVAYALGLRDASVIVALGVVIGFVPTAVTWLVTLVRG